MAEQIPKWFDPAHYATGKVDQMNAMQYLGKTDWSAETYQQELQNWRDPVTAQPLGTGTPDELAYINFLACNGSNYDSSVSRSNINVSPNQYFDVGTYLENLAQYATKHQVEGAPAGGWTAESMLMHLYNDLHISAWQHYTNVGMFAGINPSNSFDTDLYYKARAEAMNTRTVNDEVVGWLGRTDWTAAEVLEILRQAGQNPIMDAYGDGEEFFHVTIPAPPADEQVPELEGWNAWITPPPYNPYDAVEKTVELKAEQSVYTGENGVNTRYEAVWNNATAQSTINTTDTIHAGADAYNTLAMELDASWPGFKGQIGANATNIGRVELAHGAANASTPFTFDSRNISGLERVDIQDNGAGAISLKNLPGSVKLVTLNGLTPKVDGLTETTSLEYAPGVLIGGNDSLEIAVTDVGTNAAPAPVSLAGIENLSINSYTGASTLNLHTATGVRNLKIDGGGDIKITNVANGITSYDASSATGTVNMAASDIKSYTPVKGGSGDTTLTLTQDFDGAPTAWSNIDQLAIGPLVKANVNAASVHGLSSLWINTNKDVALNNLPTTGTFTVYQDSSGSKAKIDVNGSIQNLAFSTAGYAAAENGTAAPIFTSSVINNVSIHAMGEGTLAGSLEFTRAKGDVTLNVEENAAFGKGTITAVNAKNFTANVNGALAHNSKFNVVDHVSADPQSININLENGVANAPNDQLGRIILDSDGATTLNFSSKGSAGFVAKDSSLKALQNFNLDLDGADIDFNCQGLTLPQLRNLTVTAQGSSVEVGDLGSANLNATMEIKVDGASSFSMGAIQTGRNANVVANINTEGDIALSSIATTPGSTISTAPQGDIHLDFTTQGNVGTVGNKAITLSGADIFMDFGEVQGDVFVSSNVNLAALESINYTGAQGSDRLTVSKVGMTAPSNFDLGDGADLLTISSKAVTAGQRVNINVDLGEDDAADRLVVNAQGTGAKLGVFVENFEEGEDILAGFRASSLSVSSAQNLLADFGITHTPIGANQIYHFGSGNGVFYEGDLYAFNSTSNATTMVVLTGINGSVSNLAGAPLPPDPVEDEAEAGA